MRIALFSSPDGWHFRDLARAAAGRHELIACDQANLSAGIVDSKPTIRCGEVLLNAVDAALVRSMPAAGLEPIVLRMDALARLEATGVPVINSAKAIEASIAKYLATVKLAEAGLVVPDTIA